MVERLPQLLALHSGPAGVLQRRCPAHCLRLADSDSGEFTVWGRIKYSVRFNALFYLGARSSLLVSELPGSALAAIGLMAIIAMAIVAKFQQ